MKVYLRALVFLLMTIGGASGQELFKDKFENTKLGGSILKFKASFNDSLKNATELPIVIVKGKEEGKVLTILAGVHGYEYPPIMQYKSFLEKFALRT